MIWDDLETRPREHDRDDAGHSSSTITDRSIDINRGSKQLRFSLEFECIQCEGLT